MNKRITLLIIMIIGCFLALMPVAFAQEDGEETPEPEVTAEMEMTEAEMTMEAEATEEMMASMDTDTYIRFVHFAPGVDGVDVFVNDEVIDETNLSYPGVTSWMPVEAGSYNVDVAPTGGTVGDAVISANDVEVGPGFVTVVVVHNEEDEQPSTFIINETRDDLLPATSGLTLLNGLSADIPVNFDRNDVPFVTELSADGNRALYTPVDSDTYTFRAYNPFAEGDGTFGEATEIELLDGSSYLIAVVGTEDDAEVFVHETTGAEFAMVSGELEAPGTIIEAVQSRESLAAYTDIFDAAGLSETLSGEGPYTILLPADYLIDDVQNAVGDDTELLTSTLQNHVIDGNIPLGQLDDLETITTMAGNTYDVTIDGNIILIGGYQVLTANIYATNGVIHVIDGILTLPE